MFCCCDAAHLLWCNVRLLQYTVVLHNSPHQSVLLHYFIRLHVTVHYDLDIIMLLHWSLTSSYVIVTILYDLLSYSKISYIVIQLSVTLCYITLLCCCVTLRCCVTLLQYVVLHCQHWLWAIAGVQDEHWPLSVTTQITWRDFSFSFLVSFCLFSLFSRFHRVFFFV